LLVCGGESTPCRANANPNIPPSSARHHWDARHVDATGPPSNEVPMDDSIAQLNEIFQETFQDNDIEVNRDMTSNDVDGWDSLMHVSLMMNVESSFDVRFNSTEVAVLKSVGELIDLIHTKRGE
jgi:acyl carrier protein